MLSMKMKALVALLRHKTNAGQLQWEQTETNGVYQLAFPDQSIRISRRVGSTTGRPTYAIEVFNEEGLLVDDATDWDLNEAAADQRSGTEQMAELYETARRTAMRADDVLDSILSMLREPNPQR